MIRPHSPAPFCALGHTVIDAGGRRVASLSRFKFRGSSTSVSDKQIAGNANLFAAAPELAAACMAIVSVYKKGCDRDGSIDWSDLDAAHNAAKAALRKLKGGGRAR
jgi:hypothetical protein